MTMKSCPVNGCNRRARAEHLMCREHWRRVPKALQQAVWESWSRYRSEVATPARLKALSDYRKSSVAALDHVSGLRDPDAPDLFESQNASTAALLEKRPASRAVDTSIAAADSMAASVTTIRAAVLRKFYEIGDATADEVASSLGMSVLAVRPRVSELAAAGLLIDSGARRPNDSGRQAVVWRSAA